MERNRDQDQGNSNATMLISSEMDKLASRNATLAYDVIRAALAAGTRTFCFCAGSRNAPLYHALMHTQGIECLSWPEERSAAFFALGRSRATELPVAVITTSGTAAGELLPAAMEAYYSGVPLLLITADRPRRFQGSNAPQSCEQAHLYGIYAPDFHDLESGEVCSLADWKKWTPAHLNVRFEEPKPTEKYEEFLKADEANFSPLAFPIPAREHLDIFLDKARFPIIIVGALPKRAQEPIARFLEALKAPVLLEATSGLREDGRLQELRLTPIDTLLCNAHQSGYPVDAVLRIGGVPTNRIWRDLEFKKEEISVCSLSEQPFSGLSWGSVIHTDLQGFFQDYFPDKVFERSPWMETFQILEQKLQRFYVNEPTAEQSLIHALSHRIPFGAQVYLGNSLPIREWDIAATLKSRHLLMRASRGLNGIDGQISTFLGLCHPEQSNWAILGDLTTLYDMAGPWGLRHLPETKMTLVVINNSGGQIFAKLHPHNDFINNHQMNFEPLASFWEMDYACWTQIPDTIPDGGHRLIEIVPDEMATRRFWSIF